MTLWMKRFGGLGTVVVSVLIAGAISLVLFGKALWHSAEATVPVIHSFSNDHQILFFVILVVAPIFPVPLSALHVMAGMIWKDHPVGACLLSLAALALNLVLTYVIATGPLQRFVRGLLSSRLRALPELPQDDQLNLLLVLKLTPGIPYFVQNYAAGVLNVRFGQYFLVSMACNGLFTIGIVLGGVGIGDAQLMPVISGLALIALAVVLTSLMRRWLGRRKKQPKNTN
jgi:uncharacterized membrane protein YdjX (TVP38/TMEM64 family)